MDVINSKQIEKLSKKDTATIANAVEPFNFRSNTEGFMGMDVSCMFPDLGVMVGQAVTVTLDTTTHGRKHDRNVRYELFEAIEIAPNPVVIVMKNIGSRESHSCHFGDGLATICSRLGAVGVVTDGGVRDIDTVYEMNFHYFAPGVVPAHGNFGFHEVGVPVEISGVTIEPGDIIHGDVNGVVMIPPNRVDDVISESHRVLKKESELREWVSTEEFSIENLRKRIG